MKTTFRDFSPLIESWSLHGRFDDAQFIYLTRRDIAAQAVSEFLAEESGVWHRDSNGTVYHSQAIKDASEVEFDELRISELVRQFVQMQQLWEAFFVRYGIEPLRISYEELCLDVSDVVRRTAGQIGVDWTGDLSLSNAATSKMRDARSADWAERVRTKISEQGCFETISGTSDASSRAS